MKEREKEAREREARYSNGHLFTSLTVSGTTLCSACNKSITAKEALSCPSESFRMPRPEGAPCGLGMARRVCPNTNMMQLALKQSVWPK